MMLENISKCGNALKKKGKKNDDITSKIKEKMQHLVP